MRPKLSLPAMNAGDGPHSYVQNSSYQGGVLDVAKPIIEEEIAKKLDIKNLPNRFCIADFGCSTGHNSFPAIEIIIQAINQKLKSSKITSKAPEFYVIFNDDITNDFNTLFRSLPRQNVHYQAAAVPGGFHGRLLHEYFIHFAYSSWSLHWLTAAPKAVADGGSRAWNKGEILYTRDRKEVFDAYLDQFEKDIESFMESRAAEVVSGGLMALQIPAVPHFWNPECEYTILSYVNLLRSSLMDMAKKGKFSEAKVDSFNLPYYFPTPQQFKAILSKNQSFSIERYEILNNPGKHTLHTVNARAAFFRAVHERLLTDHFGSEIIDELFQLYMRKLEASPVLENTDNDKTIVILAVLKRKLI